mmetsp:Transcript_29827/g.84002  ORF Transcript_29827/g.84002 Transcript_29827/m.84002 type:complete len:204 (+) Transcript_29827:155-766(+)
MSGCGQSLSSSSGSGSIAACLHAAPSLQAAIRSGDARRSSSTCSCVLDGLPSRGPMTFASTWTSSCLTLPPANLRVKLPSYRPTWWISTSSQRRSGPPSKGFTCTERRSSDVDTTSTDVAVLDGSADTPYSCPRRTIPSCTVASPAGSCCSSRNAGARDAAPPRSPGDAGTAVGDKSTLSAQLRCWPRCDLDPSGQEPRNEER